MNANKSVAIFTGVREHFISSIRDVRSENNSMGYSCLEFIHDKIYMMIEFIYDEFVYNDLVYMIIIFFIFQKYTLSRIYSLIISVNSEI